MYFFGQTFFAAGASSTVSPSASLAPSSFSSTSEAFLFLPPFLAGAGVFSVSVGVGFPAIRVERRSPTGAAAFSVFLFVLPGLRPRFFGALAGLASVVASPLTAGTSAAGASTAGSAAAGTSAAGAAAATVEVGFLGGIVGE